ncbi:fatty acid desaturase family protein [Pseudonocardia kujensis]|uniref:fatty acid desaturase family protein n=1 Tax=Pseudonocardia kujensis TaxID=1128675 RepID=UPI001E588487|nr:fatty acid desaturase family protein [Pseudonocardia kujensis]MCE0763667.1 fatty acid desaturase family protein [Pseudonocardia kujensis]
MGRERLERYDLTGPENRAAVQSGLAGATWFRSAVPRKRMKELMRRTDGPAIRDTALWVGLMVACAGAGIALWGSWWAVPFFLVYGVLYGSASDSRWHEAGHGTAFRSRWLDEAVYQVACFMIMRDPTASRWSHTRHHTDTLVVGRDPEINVMRPARLAKLLANFLGLVDVPLAFRAMAVHAVGRLTVEEADFVPESERPKVYRTARVWLAIYVVAVTAAVVFGTWLPLVLVGGPRIYGTFMHVVYGLTQHAGMGENVLDHRLNTRTVRMCRVNRFLYWNMNFHVEHHMFPMVPYYRLPELHEEVRHDCAPVYPSLWAAYREIVPAVLQQLKDQDHYVKRELLPGAAPFHIPNELTDGRARPLAAAATPSAPASDQTAPDPTVPDPTAA